MVVVGKNLGPFCTAILEALFLDVPLGTQTLGAMLIGLVGSAVYALDDANSDLEGVGLVGLNAGLVACTAVCEKYVVKTVDQGALGLSLYRNILAVPLLGILLALGVESFPEAMYALAQASKQSLLVLAVSTVFSAAAGLLVFTLQGRVNATTTQIASLCYKLVTTSLSLVLFPEAQKDLGLLAFVGYGLSTVSVAVYAFWPKRKPVLKKAHSPLSAEELQLASPCEPDRSKGVPFWDRGFWDAGVPDPNGPHLR